MVYSCRPGEEKFNRSLAHLLAGLTWDENGQPSLKDGYATLEKLNEQEMQRNLDELLAQVEARYEAIWNSAPSKDGYFWYRYDETSFGPMMQPDAHSAYDKAYTSEGQNGVGAVAYLTQLHPDVILDYKLSNIQYEGENATYIKEGEEHGLREDGTEALGEVPTRR